MEMAAEWKEVTACLVDYGEEQSGAEKLLDRLNALVYPLDGIQYKVLTSINTTCSS